MTFMTHNASVLLLSAKHQWIIIRSFTSIHNHFPQQQASHRKSILLRKKTPHAIMHYVMINLYSYIKNRL